MSSQAQQDNSMEAELDKILDKEFGMMRKRLLVLIKRRERKVAKEVAQAMRSSKAPSRTRDSTRPPKSSRPSKHTSKRDERVKKPSRRPRTPDYSPSPRHSRSLSSDSD